MTPHLADIDLTGITELAVPVVQFLGRHDHMTPPELAVEWLERLSAPSKAMQWFEDSAHMPMYEEPGRFLVSLLQHVLPVSR